MSTPRPDRAPHGQHKPLRTMFLITSMHVGGAETLLMNMMRRFDPLRVVPFLGCLKEFGKLGHEISGEFQCFEHLIHHKFDIPVIRRLARLFRQLEIDSVITVGAGDKMFWGRLAARQARVPVVLSALHSTGWPDDIGCLNRLLTPITDAFIAVAEPHRQFLVQQKHLPIDKVKMIPNGIDTERFRYCDTKRKAWRHQLDIPADALVCGIVAALRPEKNHELFLRLADRLSHEQPDRHFLIVGDGPQRDHLESIANSLASRKQIHFAGNLADTPGVLSAMDFFSLTSHNEANPVSILEAMSVGLPVVAPQVGSIDQSVLDGQTGWLVESGNESGFVHCWEKLFRDDGQRASMGHAGRRHVQESGSLQKMTDGYTDLIEEIYRRKAGRVEHLRNQPTPTVCTPSPSLPVVESQNNATA